MKILTMALLMFFVATEPPPLFTQEASDPPDITVGKKSWRKVVRNPALDEDPFRANDEQAQFERAQKDNAIRNAQRTREGNLPQQTVRLPRPLETEAQMASTRYVYRATVHNTGTKTTLVFAWDYRFLHPETKEEIGHHSFIQKLKVRPGKTAELIGHSVSPPTRVIDATQAGKEVQFSEEVSIKRIEYADGSVWQRPAN